MPQPTTPPIPHPPEPQSPHLGQLPKLHFPKFDGTAPQLWIIQANSYFDMYFVDPAMQVRVATMHFTGNAKRWLQSIAHRLEQTEWLAFCALLRERLCRDQHELLLPNSDLVKQLSAYTTNLDTLSYVTRFINGLRDDIRSVVLI